MNASFQTRRPVKAKYEDAVQAFRIEDRISVLSGDLSNLNPAVECCDRHCGQGRVALRFLGAGGEFSELTFEQLRDMSARFAHVLRRAGVGPGDVVAALLPRTPELLVTILAAWRVGAAYQPLFTAFGPKAIEHRLKTAGTRFLVTNSVQREKLTEIANLPPVATIASPGRLPEGDIDFHRAISEVPHTFPPVMRTGDDLMLMMSTSGTTGLPKGVPVPNRALLAFASYMHHGIGLQSDDVFWNIADPGWAYGLYYGAIGPLLVGQATTFVEAAFSADSLCETVERIGVTSLAGSPTAFRLLMAAGTQKVQCIQGRLRVVSSAGEPLNPEVIRWFDQVINAPIHDHYGQTELGMVVNNHHGLEHPVRPGSAGFPMPGYRVVVLDDDGRELGPNQPGVLSIDVEKSPLLWFGGYHQQETPALAGGYYRTGDTVEIEPDGSFSFIGRSDDVITSSGYRIGPFDVESALLEHSAVVESAVVGVPDPERTEIVKAFVVLAQGCEGTPELAEELRLHVRARLSAHAYPRAVEFVAELPKTSSGKLQRFILRNAEIAKLTDNQKVPG
ncbi:AMP-binding protein [Agrobacterium sp. CCNWLW71]|uniref:AMP-binding protein n=1 Tax=unclassified Agrobacterium TaxID=2632611 RepID=UPI002FF285B9